MLVRPLTWSWAVSRLGRLLSAYVCLVLEIFCIWPSNGKETATPACPFLVRSQPSIQMSRTVRSPRSSERSQYHWELAAWTSWLGSPRIQVECSKLDVLNYYTVRLDRWCDNKPPHRTRIELLDWRKRHQDGSGRQKPLFVDAEQAGAADTIVSVCHCALFIDTHDRVMPGGSVHAREEGGPLSIQYSPVSHTKRATGS